MGDLWRTSTILLVLFGAFTLHLANNKIGDLENQLELCTVGVKDEQ
jgi:hypothetical protein